jgi:hypothetical protein
MLRSLPLLALLALALGACVLPLATGSDNCVSYCGLLQGCAVPGAPSGDCGTWCSAFTTQLAQEGCQQQFDDVTSCAVGEGTCEAASCGAQTQAILDCQNTYCAANPTVTFCQPQ